MQNTIYFQLPTIVPFLNDVYQLVNVRKRSQDRLTSMQGRLELMLSHIQSRESHDSAASNEQQQALFVYEEGINIHIHCYCILSLLIVK